MNKCIAMFVLHCLILLLVQLVWSAETTSAQNAQSLGHFLPRSQAVLQDKHYIFRDGAEKDIDDITTVILDAFGPGDMWQYMRLNQSQYRNYTWHCLRKSMKREWHNISTRTSVKVVEVPSKGTAGGVRGKVVALGVWRHVLPNDTATSTMDSFMRTLQLGLGRQASQHEGAKNTQKYDCSAHSDLNITRASDVEKQLQKIQRRYIDEAFSHHLYLNLLATHPAWDGYGFGAMNLHWGIELAEKLQIPVTLIATPAGYPLYKSVGFDVLKNATVKTLDGWGGGSLWFEVMKYLKHSN